MISFLEILGKTYYNSNFLSYKIRKLIERVNIRKLAGIQLASTVFFAGIIIPQVYAISSSVSVSRETEKTPVYQDMQTQLTFIWPLTHYQISQGFKFYHPGLDLTTDSGEPVFAISEGTVSETGFSNWGYGKHIIIKHDNNYSSLYAHLSQIKVKDGDRVTQGMEIGNVGSTGWSTGPHLHLEIHSPEGPVNPSDVLPQTE